MRGANLFQIVRDTFQPYVFKANARRFSIVNIANFGVFPTASGAALAWLAGPISSSGNDIYIAVFAVVGAVLTALLAVVQNVVAATDAKTPYDVGARNQESARAVRIEVLRELYANIAYAVLLMVLCGIPIVLLDVETLPKWMKYWCSGAVYAVSVLVIVTFLHIVSGVYLVLDVQAAEASSRLKELDEQAERERKD